MWRTGVAADRTDEEIRVLKKLRLLLLGAVLIVCLILGALQQFLASVGGTRQPVTEINVEGHQVALWKPAGPAPAGGYPVILFSHGFTGCNTQSIDLMEALASAGYLVLAPNHQDAMCGSARRKGEWYPTKLFEKLYTTRSQQPFRSPDAWSDTTYRDRADDVEAILNKVLSERTFQGVPLDAQCVGIAGHSLGGYTALGLAGAWPSWKDRRIKAVLGLSPYCAPFILKGDLRHLGVPAMYQGGTLDLNITPSVRRLGGAFDLTSAPKYYVEFAGAGHFAWTNLSKQYQTLIASYAVRFFDRYLKDQPGSTDPIADTAVPKQVKTFKAVPK